MFHMPRSSYLLIKSSRFLDTFTPLQFKVDRLQIIVFANKYIYVSQLQASQRFRIATVQCSASLTNSATGISLSINFNCWWVLMFTSSPDAMLELRPPKQPHSSRSKRADPVSRATQNSQLPRS